MKLTITQTPLSLFTGTCFGIFHFTTSQKSREEGKPQIVDRGYKRILMPHLFPIVIHCLLCQVYPLVYFIVTQLFIKLYITI